MGIAKYKITIEGAANSHTDSMKVIFGDQKFMVILYLPDFNNPGKISEKIFIDDFKTKKSIALDKDAKTYKTDTLNMAARYDFLNTQKVAGSSNVLCIKYIADPAKIDKERMSGAECLAAIDYRNSSVINYYFLGIQPIIIDNRIVMDFIITQPDGIKQRTYIDGIKKMENTESYFNIDDYKPIK